MKFLKFLRMILYSISSFSKFFFQSNIVEIIDYNETNALLLSSFRREEQLDDILQNEKIGTINLNHTFQKKINGIFFGNVNLKYFEYVLEIKNKKINIFLYKIYLFNLLKFLKKKYKLKFIINFAIHYKSEYLYDKIANDLDLKFLTFHRECLYATQNLKDTALSNIKKLEKFKGSRIIVHNKIVKEIFSKSGYCEENKIDIIGPLRTDQILKYSSQKKNSQSKTILFYIFGTGAMLHTGKNIGSDWSDEIGWFNLLSNTYKSILTIADEFQNCEFIFKAKYDSIKYKEYHLNHTKNFKGTNIRYITEEKNYSLLKKSDLVISFNSTTILEALLFNKNVLIPNFNEASDEKYSDYVAFKELNKTKLICNNTEQFMGNVSNLILDNDEFHLSKIERETLFRKYIGEPDGKNSNRIKNLISSLN